MIPTDIQQLLEDYKVLHGELKPREYKPERYDLGFLTRGLHPCVDAAHKAIQWWLNDILHGEKDRVRWVTLHGHPGCGKTHLCKKAVHVLREHGKTAQWWPWSELKQKLMDGESYPGLWHHVATMPHLAIDDIFTGYMESDKAHAMQATLFYDLLESRLGKWTLFTTNVHPSDMPDVRVASRLTRDQNIIVNMQEAADFSYLLHLARKHDKKPDNAD